MRNTPPLNSSNPQWSNSDKDPGEDGINLALESAATHFANQLDRLDDCNSKLTTVCAALHGPIADHDYPPLPANCGQIGGIRDHLSLLETKLDRLSTLISIL